VIVPSLSRLEAQDLPSISVVICTLNEEECLPHVLPRIPAYVSEVVLVDGHSTDATVEVARRLRPDIKILLQPGRGKGDALRHGLRYATGDIVVTLDADGSTDPAEMGHLIAPLFNGYEFVKGSRFRWGLPRRMPLHRIFGNVALAAIASLVFQRLLTDICSGYTAIWRKALPRLGFESGEGSEVESVLVFRAIKHGLRVTEVGHRDGGRIAGNSKMPSLREGWNNLRIIMRERFRP
jgi:glycosyltransferase involved in cell wall biosynthesis